MQQDRRVTKLQDCVTMCNECDVLCCVFSHEDRASLLVGQRRPAWQAGPRSSRIKDSPLFFILYDSPPSGKQKMRLLQVGSAR